MLALWPYFSGGDGGGGETLLLNSVLTLGLK